ncbi:hypothetical protein BDA96_10G354500 [Sorghum bicolor]|uniref:Uncharacterized protein n=1 Tax=Sorghum bicolor TaxID=4558 RepID=A0A921Q8R1_SORBI|nr:hypothetical protein BDA96_10G354500 [Sorghum bicolor]
MAAAGGRVQRGCAGAQHSVGVRAAAWRSAHRAGSRPGGGTERASGRAVQGAPSKEQAERASGAGEAVDFGRDSAAQPTLSTSSNIMAARTEQSSNAEFFLMLLLAAA